MSDKIDKEDLELLTAVLDSTPTLWGYTDVELKDSEGKKLTLRYNFDTEQWEQV